MFVFQVAGGQWRGPRIGRCECVVPRKLQNPIVPHRDGFVRVAGHPTSKQSKHLLRYFAVGSRLKYSASVVDLRIMETRCNPPQANSNECDFDLRYGQSRYTTCRLAHSRR